MGPYRTYVCTEAAWTYLFENLDVVFFLCGNHLLKATTKYAHNTIAIAYLFCFTEGQA